jgi:isopentenyl-diphosphate delta-isomerase
MTSHGLERSAPLVRASGVETVVLVDENDRELGTAEKLAAHRDGGRLHRAFSVFLFDDRGRVLLQQRAATKYHFPLLWTNACCGHPRPGEEVLGAARRRVAEELGVEVALRPAFSFVYTAEDTESGLTEREFDHVLLGRLSAHPRPDPEEVSALAWWAAPSLLGDVAARPQRYTPWFREALPELAARGLLRTAAG